MGSDLDDIQGRILAILSQHDALTVEELVKALSEDDGKQSRKGRKASQSKRRIQAMSKHVLSLLGASSPLRLAGAVDIDNNGRYFLPKHGVLGVEHNTNITRLEVKGSADSLAGPNSAGPTPAEPTFVEPTSGGPASTSSAGQRLSTGGYSQGSSALAISLNSGPMLSGDLASEVSTGLVRQSPENSLANTPEKAVNEGEAVEMVASSAEIDMVQISDNIIDSTGAVIDGIRPELGLPSRTESLSPKIRQQKMRRSLVLKISIAVAMALALAIVGYGSLIELKTSQLQSKYFSWVAAQMTYQVGPGPSDSIIFPEHGPYDSTLGYSLIPQVLARITKSGYRIAEQARLSPEHLDYVRSGVYPQYIEKSQAGLTIFDRDGKTLFSSLYPQLIYENFSDIPPIVVNTLLFIENRDLLDPKYPYKNPIIEWERLGKAVLDLIISKFINGHEVPGGSTLATQIEKYRHSPEGRTSNVKEKIRQMRSATIRAYLGGRDTTEARKRVIKDYINSVPLGAIPGGGEVRGIGRGMVAWHGANFAKANDLLSKIGTETTDSAEISHQAQAYKEILSLFLSQRRPAFYLQSNRGALKKLVKKHLNILRQAGIISQDFQKSVDKADLMFRNNMLMFQPERLNFLERKGANAVRVNLLNIFGFDRLYTLDRFDLEVRSTLDYQVQKDVTELLQKLKDRTFAAKNGLSDHRLLDKGNPADVIYSLTISERVGNTTVLRVQADNVDGPFNVNEGGKLELGSTAKLRTLVHYLQVIESIWQALRILPMAQLEEYKPNPLDTLTLWGQKWLLTAKDKSLSNMLENAMDRTYSANPGEGFVTGAGLHRFSNFSSDDNSRVVTVREAIRRSINLPFIRIMKDIVAFHTARIPSVNKIIADPDNIERRKYLQKFASKEGRVYLGRFYLTYRGQSGEDILNTLYKKIHMTPRKLASVDSVVRSESTLEDFRALIKKLLPNSGITEKGLESIYKEVYKGKYTLQDRGYIAGIHPLELWLVAHMYQNPGSDFDDVMLASTNARQEAYQWLFSSKDKAKQDRRIKIMLETEAFVAIHKAWQQTGYPFDRLIPTFATALGSSGDRPSALAELMSIIISDGYKYPQIRAEEFHFAKGTPFETKVQSYSDSGVRVLSPELAKIVKTAIRAVVDDGTAIRIKNVFVDSHGKPIPVGGKTGTGDNRYSIYAPGGRVIEAKAMSRTATFVFYIGDRFFGSLTAFVPSATAGNFDFTSALPVQILKILAPKLTPLIARSERQYQEQIQ